MKTKLTFCFDNSRDRPLPPPTWLPVHGFARNAFWWEDSHQLHYSRTRHWFWHLLSTVRASLFISQKKSRHIASNAFCIILMLITSVQRSSLRILMSWYPLINNGRIPIGEGSGTKNSFIEHLIFPVSSFPNHAAGDWLMIRCIKSSMDGHWLDDNFHSENRALLLWRTSLHTCSTVRSTMDNKLWQSGVWCAFRLLKLSWVMFYRKSLDTSRSNWFLQNKKSILLKH